MSNIDLSKTKKETYFAFWRGVNLGYFTPDSLNINGELLGDPLEVDQIEQAIARLEYRGIEPTIGMTIAQDSEDFLYNTLLPGLVGFRAGTEGPLFGWGDIGEDALLHAGVLELIPVKNEAGSKLNSFAMERAYLSPQTITLLKGKGRFGETPIEFKALSDDDAPRKFRYLKHGNLLAEGQAPNGVFITCEKSRRPVPSVHMPAITVAAGTFDRLTAWLFYSQDSSITAAINDGGDIDATQTTIIYDTLAGGNFIEGDIILIDNEYMYVVSFTSTVLTVVRGVNGSTNILHLNDAVITKQQNVFYWPGTNLVTWLSSAPTKVSVGDVVGANDATEKGRITNVSADAVIANITATLQAVPSEDTVVTPAA